MKLSDNVSGHASICPLTRSSHRSAGEIPLAVIIAVFVAFALGIFTLTGCSPATSSQVSGAATAPADAAVSGSPIATVAKLAAGPSAQADSQQASGPVATRNLLPIRAVHVQQYEDRIPQETGSKLPGVITLVQFEIDVCEDDVSDANFTALPESVGGFARVQVITNRMLLKCASPHTQQFTASTGAFSKGAAIAVANPLLVEVLAPSN